MRIAENSPQRLVLNDRSIWMTALCFVAVILLVVVPLAAHAGRANFWLPLLFVGFGLAFFRSSTVKLDRATQLCTLNKLSLTHRSRVRIPFADIQDVNIEPEPLNTSSQQPSYRLSLATSAGPVPLSDTYEPGFEHNNQIRNAILKVIGKPDALATQPDPVRFLVKQGRIVDAVALLRQRDNLDLATARKRVAEMQDMANGN